MTQIPDKGKDDHPLYTLPSLMMIASGYVRIVNGGRGSYVEFEKRHMVEDALFMPPLQKWRIGHSSAYFLEYRTKVDNVKIYYQRRLVSYADYRLKMFYIALDDLVEATDRDLAEMAKKVYGQGSC